MKKTLFVFLFVMMCICASAQDIASDFKTESKAALLEGNKGLLIRRDCFETKQIMGIASTIQITPTILTDLSTGQKEAYINLSSMGLTSKGTNNKSSYIDLDELSAILDAMDYMLSTVISEKPSHHVDVTITTRDGLIIAVTYDTTQVRGDKWGGSLHHTKYLSGEITPVSTKVLQNLKGELEASKAFLEKELLK